MFFHYALLYTFIGLSTVVACFSTLHSTEAMRKKLWRKVTANRIVSVTARSFDLDMKISCYETSIIAVDSCFFRMRNASPNRFFVFLQRPLLYIMLWIIDGKSIFLDELVIYFTVGHVKLTLKLRNAHFSHSNGQLSLAASAASVCALNDNGPTVIVRAHHINLSYVTVGNAVAAELSLERLTFLINDSPLLAINPITLTISQNRLGNDAGVSLRCGALTCVSTTRFITYLACLQSQPASHSDENIPWLSRSSVRDAIIDIYVSNIFCMLQCRDNYAACTNYQMMPSAEKSYRSYLHCKYEYQTEDDEHMRFTEYCNEKFCLAEDSMNNPFFLPQTFQNTSIAEFFFGQSEDVGSRLPFCRLNDLFLNLPGSPPISRTSDSFDIHSHSYITTEEDLWNYIMWTGLPHRQQTGLVGPSCLALRCHAVNMTYSSHVATRKKLTHTVIDISIQSLSFTAADTPADAYNTLERALQKREANDMRIHPVSHMEDIHARLIMRHKKGSTSADGKYAQLLFSLGKVRFFASWPIALIIVELYANLRQEEFETRISTVGRKTLRSEEFRLNDFSLQLKDVKVRAVVNESTYLCFYSPIIFAGNKLANLVGTLRHKCVVSFAPPPPSNLKPFVFQEVTFLDQRTSKPYYQRARTLKALRIRCKVSHCCLPCGLIALALGATDYCHWQKGKQLTEFPRVSQSFYTMFHHSSSNNVYNSLNIAHAKYLADTLDFHTYFRLSYAIVFRGAILLPSFIPESLRWEDAFFTESLTTGIPMFAFSTSIFVGNELMVNQSGVKETIAHAHKAVVDELVHMDIGTEKISDGSFISFDENTVTQRVVVLVSQSATLSSCIPHTSMLIQLPLQLQLGDLFDISITAIRAGLSSAELQLRKWTDHRSGLMQAVLQETLGLKEIEEELSISFEQERTQQTAYTIACLIEDNASFEIRYTTCPLAYKMGTVFSEIYKLTQLKVLLWDLATFHFTLLEQEAKDMNVQLPNEAIDKIVSEFIASLTSYLAECEPQTLLCIRSNVSFSKSYVAIDMLPLTSEYIDGIISKQYTHGRLSNNTVIDTTRNIMCVIRGSGPFLFKMSTNNIAQSHLWTEFLDRDPSSDNVKANLRYFGGLRDLFNQGATGEHVLSYDLHSLLEKSCVYITRILNMQFRIVSGDITQISLPLINNMIGGDSNLVIGPINLYLSLMSASTGTPVFYSGTHIYEPKEQFFRLCRPLCRSYSKKLYPGVTGVWRQELSNRTQFHYVFHASFESIAISSHIRPTYDSSCRKLLLRDTHLLASSSALAKLCLANFGSIILLSTAVSSARSAFIPLWHPFWDICRASAHGRASFKVGTFTLQTVSSLEYHSHVSDTGYNMLLTCTNIKILVALFSTLFSTETISLSLGRIFHANSQQCSVIEPVTRITIKNRTLFTANYAPDRAKFLNIWGLSCFNNNLDCFQPTINYQSRYFDTRSLTSCSCEQEEHKQKQKYYFDYFLWREPLLCRTIRFTAQLTCDTPIDLWTCRNPYYFIDFMRYFIDLRPVVSFNLLYQILIGYEPREMQWRDDVTPGNVLNAHSPYDSKVLDTIDVRSGSFYNAFNACRSLAIIGNRSILSGHISLQGAEQINIDSCTSFALSSLRSDDLMPHLEFHYFTKQFLMQVLDSEHNKTSFVKIKGSHTRYSYSEATVKPYTLRTNLREAQILFTDRDLVKLAIYLNFAAPILSLKRLSNNCINRDFPSVARYSSLYRYNLINIFSFVQFDIKCSCVGVKLVSSGMRLLLKSDKPLIISSNYYSIAGSLLYGTAIRKHKRTLCTFCSEFISKAAQKGKRYQLSANIEKLQASIYGDDIVNIGSLFSGIVQSFIGKQKELLINRLEISNAERVFHFDKIRNAHTSYEKDYSDDIKCLWSPRASADLEYTSSESFLDSERNIPLGTVPNEANARLNAVHNQYRLMDELNTRFLTDVLKYNVGLVPITEVILRINMLQVSMPLYDPQNGYENGELFHTIYVTLSQILLSGVLFNSVDLIYIVFEGKISNLNIGTALCKEGLTLQLHEYDVQQIDSVESNCAPMTRELIHQAINSNVDSAKTLQGKPIRRDAKNNVMVMHTAMHEAEARKTKIVDVKRCPESIRLQTQVTIDFLRRTISIGNVEMRVGDLVVRLTESILRYILHKLGKLGELNTTTHRKANAQASPPMPHYTISLKKVMIYTISVQFLFADAPDIFSVYSAHILLNGSRAKMLTYQEPLPKCWLADSYLTLLHHFKARVPRITNTQKTSLEQFLAQERESILVSLKREVIFRLPETLIGALFNRVNFVDLDTTRRFDPKNAQSSYIVDGPVVFHVTLWPDLAGFRPQILLAPFDFETTSKKG